MTVEKEVKVVGDKTPATSKDLVVKIQDVQVVLTYLLRDVDNIKGAFFDGYVNDKFYKEELHLLSEKLNALINEMTRQLETGGQ